MTGPVVIVTGASAGIGAATAKHFGGRNYRVVLAARRMGRLQELAGEIKDHGGAALAVETDISELSQVEHLVQKTLDEFGQIDILVNNAGMGRLRWLDELDPEQDIAYQVRVNLLGTIQATRLVLPHMMKRRSGHIINISSVAAWIAPPTYSIYTATKFGIKGFSESLRREVKAYGIHVGTMYPGGVSTEFDEQAGVPWDTETTTPSWLLLEAEDIARGIHRMVEKRKRGMMLPRVMKLAVWANQIFPGVVDWVLSRYFSRDGGKSKIWGEVE